MDYLEARTAGSFMDKRCAGRANCFINSALYSIRAG
jgi:hypothetical protein